MLTQQQLREAIPTTLSGVDLPGYGAKQTGKVRDIYQQDDTLVLITTDRISAFDRVLGLIPFKGQVLNQLSA
jgi:phosphoribosylaminoimidazole-succinocarboxamide synthase